MNRREFIKYTTAAGLGTTLPSLPKAIAANRPHKKLKYLILGLDGMDIKLASTFMRLGLLPNFSKLAQVGSLTTAATSYPPQSPVAWSSFAVGGWPDLHGIYDFIHRDPATMIPYLSTSKVVPPSKTLKIAGYELPLTSGTVLNLRKGKPFWNFLADYDIPTSIFKIPGNFPCQSDRVSMVSGMGTPDLRGGYGSFTLFATSPPANHNRITGGMVVPLTFVDGLAETRLSGPENTLRQGHPLTSIPIKIWRDPQNAVVRLQVQDKEFILNQGDWTGWQQLSFTMLNHISEVKGLCKFYIKSVHPEFSMYVSPINIDPSDPALPIVSSPNYGKELSRHLGAFYTQGMPEDTKALSYDILNNSEYMDLAYQIIHERRRAMNYEAHKLSKLDEGLLFFYFSSLDQDSHMFWRTIDHHSPLYTKDLGKKFGNVLKNLYIEMDNCLGDIMGLFDIHDPSFRLVVMSDHGFGPFRRQVNLNSWLHEQGFISLYDGSNLEDGEYFANVNWGRTAAYALGINGLYLNLENREKFGSLSRGRAKGVLKKIRQGLLTLRDPQNGQRVITNIRMTTQTEKGNNPQAPDLIIGWNRGYRTSWSSILGSFDNETIKDNNDRWSGDHCIDPQLVPSILFSNQKISKAAPTLPDVTATILADFGIPIPKEMVGGKLYKT